MEDLSSSKPLRFIPWEGRTLRKIPKSGDLPWKELLLLSVGRIIAT
ncbi:hypothetical protein CNEO_1320015 [Clostridium neonatale]|nr:hypothetical protein CNEO_1320015 [Clostridium neonatale]